MVDAGVDHGEILTMGRPVEVWHEFREGTKTEQQETLREYANAHQSFQKVRSDWPALTTALTLIADGSLALSAEYVFHDEWRQVYLHENALSYAGFQVKE